MRSQRTTLGWSQRVRMAASRSARLASSRERKMSSVHLRATTRWPSLAAYSIDARMSLYRGVRFPTATTNTGGWEAHENAAVGAGAHLPLDAVGGEDLVRVVGAPAGQLNSWSGSSWLSGSWRRSRDAAASVVADAERVHRRADEAGHRKARCNRSGELFQQLRGICAGTPTRFSAWSPPCWARARPVHRSGIVRRVTRSTFVCLRISQLLVLSASACALVACSPLGGLGPIYGVPALVSLPDGDAVGV